MSPCAKCTWPNATDPCDPAGGISQQAHGYVQPRDRTFGPHRLGQQDGHISDAAADVEPARASRHSEGPDRRAQRRLTEWVHAVEGGDLLASSLDIDVQPFPSVLSAYAGPVTCPRSLHRVPR